MSEATVQSNPATAHRAGDDAGTYPSSVVERYLSRKVHGTGMVFESIFRLDSAPEIEPLRQAWLQTVQRHRRLRSTLSGTGRHQHWQLTEIRIPRCFAVSDAPLTDRSGGLPLPNVRDGVGGVLTVSRCQTRPGIRFQFHHGACDGIGAARIVGDFFAALHGHSRTPTSQHEPPTADDDDGTTAAAAETTSESDGGGSSAGDATGTVTLPDFRNTWKTIRGRNVRFAPHVVRQVRKASSEPIEFDHGEFARDTLLLELDTLTSANLRRWLRTKKLPLNDFAVAAVSLALAEHSSSVAGRRMHVMVVNPVQMRSWQQRRCSANHLGFAFIRRRHADLDSANPASVEQAIDSIHQELHSVRSLGIAGELMWGIGQVERIPGVLPVMERTGWFSPTASVTSLSSVRYARRYGFAGGPKVGDADILRFSMAAPLQHDGQLAVTVWDVAGTIGLSFRVAQAETDWLAAANAVADSIRKLSGAVSSSVLQPATV
ncbi:hypothetical protein FYK55_00680 [Roseiconus nitratireducens]|uniref:Condensation domain-containing protein n=1 Tax=Roseiconus nitratireducens TaxID=2605748 RepID=A0A5M6DLG0_9BACT|nr:hypothetical protein [Roseiconus nitratireducens]KAA5546970.1 hypothetical protein FYK55_00680 [Roseiconus nitratireducens]